MLTQKEARAMWARRLEARPERQGRNSLAPTPRTRCCLGELCDMAVELGVINGYDGSAVTLASYPEVMDLVGLASTTGGYTIGDPAGAIGRSLADDNDTGLSWPEIAAVIRSEPEGLFK